MPWLVFCCCWNRWPCLVDGRMSSSSPPPFITTATTIVTILQVAGDYLARDIACAATDARIVIIATQVSQRPRHKQHARVHHSPQLLNDCNQHQVNRPIPVSFSTRLSPPTSSPPPAPPTTSDTPLPLHRAAPQPRLMQAPSCANGWSSRAPPCALSRSSRRQAAPPCLSEVHT